MKRRLMTSGFLTSTSINFIKFRKIVGYLIAIAFIVGLPGNESMADVPSVLSSSPLVLHVDHSDTGTSWDLDVIKSKYPDAYIQDGFLVYTKNFEDDYGRSAESDSSHSIDALPNIDIVFAVNSQSIYVGTTGTDTESFSLIAANSIIGAPWQPTRNTLDSTYSHEELALLMVDGFLMGIEPHIKLTTIYGIQKYEYVMWKEWNALDNPLSNVDIILKPKAAIQNNTETDIVAIYAAMQTKWGDMSDFIKAQLDAWWPKGHSDDTGSAWWQFDFDIVGGGVEWFANTRVSGDNGTAQEIFWEGNSYLKHSNYGSIRKIEFLSSQAPGSIKLSYSNVWSGGLSYISYIFSATDIVFDNIIESPEVGDPPQPQKLILTKGWNGDVGISDTDNDGVPDQWDACANTPAGSCVDNKGCQSGSLRGDLNNDGQVNIFDAVKLVQYLVGNIDSLE